MTTPKTAWVQLYQARQIKADIVESRPPGTPAFAHPAAESRADALAG